MSLTRRRFLGSTAVGLAGSAVLPSWADEPKNAPKVAAIFTEFRFRSHAFNILENFLEPYLFCGRWVEPACKVVSFYADQFPDIDMGRRVAKDYGIPLYKTIGEALTLGGKDLGVDAVLMIVEHGEYPTNDRGVKEYPRKEFFDEVVKVFKQSGRSVPVFNDKHLSYRWDWAKEMYDTSVAMKFPLHAGSSVPLAERRPALELPADAKITEAVSIHGGGFEVYDFHALEVLQSVVEGRAGGESGVKQVQFLEGDALWKAADAGLWSEKLADAAMAAEIGPGHPPLRQLVRTEAFGAQGPWGVLVTYRDGFRGIALKAGKSSVRWNFACRLEGEKEPRATHFYVGPWGNRNLFMALANSIHVQFVEKQAPYPVERTLLTTGIVAAAVESKVQGGKALDTPHLAVAYKSRDFKRVRESGASWKVLTKDTPEPTGLKTKS